MCEPSGTIERPTFEAFLGQLGTLSSEQARELAEIARVPDWRRDRGVAGLANFIPVPTRNGPQMGYKGIAAADVARSEAAIDEARRIIGADTVAAARSTARETLAGRRLSWRGMHLHRPVRYVQWGPLAVAAVLFLLGPTSTDQPRFGGFAALLVLAALAWLAGYLLPPDQRDLRYVVELAAVAHVAGPSLPDEHFALLAGGWYAVLDGRWRRGRRPYRLWGCLLVGIAGVVLLAALLAVTGAGT